jgi:hypothetical protein
VPLPGSDTIGERKTFGSCFSLPQHLQPSTKRQQHRAPLQLLAILRGGSETVSRAVKLQKSKAHGRIGWKGERRTTTQEGSSCATASEQREHSKATEGNSEEREGEGGKEGGEGGSGNDDDDDDDQL